MSRRSNLALGLVVLLGLVFLSAPPTGAEEEPQYGGVLRAAIAGDAPSLDPHQETTFKTIQVVAPAYNTLLMFSPSAYPEIVGDLATDWQASDDGLTYTVQIRKGVKFHDGTPLTAADVKASYEHIVNPPQGVFSVRQANYQMVESIDTPDDHTIVFKLKHPSASFLANLASPWNVIYPKKYLDQDPNYFKKNVVGSGPFKFKRWVRGSTFELEKNDDYFVEGRPYLDGVKFFMIKNLSARAKALRAGNVDIEFRNMPPAEVEAMKKQRGDEINVQYPGWVTFWGVAYNTERKPFDDVRVRQALSLAIDRYQMAETIYPLTGLNKAGALVRPGSQWSMSSEELQDLVGYGQDAEANRQQAKQLLAEAGYPDGFEVVLKNRNVKLPYIDFAVYVVSEWQKIGVKAEHRLEETATWRSSQRNGDFEVVVTPGSDYVDEPDIQLSRYVGDSPQNYGRFDDPKVNELYDKQSRELDPAKRKEMVNEIERIVLNNAYFLQGLWSSRAVVHSARLRDYFAHPSHYSNQRLQDAWLAKE